MGYIRNLRLIGFKKFKNFELTLNQGTNILVGENQSGKSTIIEAIDLLINKTYENSDRYILADLFNLDNVSNFQSDPSFETLPTIDIIAEFEINTKEKYCSEYYGLNWYGSDKKTSKYGIWFQCAIDKEYTNEVCSLIKNKIIPLEYYSISWRTFKNEPYNKLKKIVKFVPIDSSNNTTFNTIDFYSKRLFLKKYENDLSQIKTDFRTNIDIGFGNLNLPELETNKKFTLNHKKLLLENIISIKDDGVLIENKGRGEEKIIKTRLSLKDKQSNDVIAIEEPENNLSHINLRKLIFEIEKLCSGKQLIVTTHNNLIVTGLLLENVIWISNTKNKTLKDLDAEKKSVKTSDYFKKLENNNLLRFILANKVILVEGATEQLLVPYLFSQKNESIEECKIDVISCNGLSFMRFIDVATTLNKKVAILTDNDGDSNKIEESKKFNEKHVNIKIFMPNDIKEYTWEVAIKKLNTKKIERLIHLQEFAKYLVKGEELEDKYLAYMLNHKVDVALKMANSGEKYDIPNYLEELFKWIKE